MDNSRILDDLTRVAGGAFSVFSALGKQLQNNLKDQMGDKFSSSSNADDVTRLQGVVTKLRMEQEDLKSRIAELETMLGKKAAPKKIVVKKTTEKKTGAKKTTVKKAILKKKKA